MPRFGQEVCLSQEALLLLWQAEKCGLASRHWVVDALRAFAAEDRTWGAKMGERASKIPG